MSITRLGRLLLTLGLFVGVVAAVGLIVHFRPSRLPAGLLDLAAYKLTFLAALGLLAAGATLVRSAHERATRTGRGGVVALPVIAPPPAPEGAGVRPGADAAAHRAAAPVDDA